MDTELVALQWGKTPASGKARVRAGGSSLAWWSLGFISRIRRRSSQEGQRAPHPCSFLAREVSKCSLQSGGLQQQSNTFFLNREKFPVVRGNAAVTVLADFLISFFRRAPTATFHDSKHNIVHVHFDATRGWLLTSGTDKVIKVGARNML